MRALPGLLPLCPAARFSSGTAGHLWEQSVLPLRAAKAALWSPSTSGPVIHRNHIVTIHDLAFIDVRECFSRRFALWYGALIRQLAGNARHIIAVSDFTKRRLLEHYRVPETKITRIHSGVSAAFHPRSAAAVEATSQRLGIKQGKYIVGFLGTDMRKNTARLLQAWAKADTREAELILFGRAANTQVFAKGNAIRMPPGVRCVGAVDDDDLAAIYSGASGLVFPSRYEGFGLPVVEAASCGCRVVASNSSALPEISPADAILVDPNNTGEIAAAIHFLLETADDPQSKAARAAGCVRFTWQEAAAAYQQTFSRYFA